MTIEPFYPIFDLLKEKTKTKNLFEVEIFFPVSSGLISDVSLRNGQNNFFPETNKHTDKQTNIRTNKQAYKQRKKQANKQTN